jgi:Fe-S-cluster containining protein
MKNETDVKHIEKLAARKEEENWQFRSYLKGWSGLSSEEIDALFQQFFADVAAEIDCNKCANCCKKISPALKAKDIETLATHLGISNSTLCEEYLIESDYDDGLSFKTLPCPFLKDNLCTVYSFRPHDCRSYPHLHKTDRVFSLYTIISNCSVCPIVYNVYEILKENIWHPGQMDELRDFEYE